MLHLESDSRNTAQITLDVAGGLTQECSQTGGSNVMVTSVVNIPENDSLATIQWQVDGTNVSTAESINEFLNLGQHRVTAQLGTVNGLSASAEVDVLVQDTIAPEVSADFINRFTNSSLIDLQFFNALKVEAAAVDVCDPAPVVEAMYGSPVQDNDSLLIFKRSGYVIMNIDTLDLSVRATDSSNNSAVSTRSIVISE